MESNRGDYIVTLSGTLFYPRDPQPEDMHLSDIANALANLCRYGGHVPKFYSVAQHSVLCARMAEKMRLHHALVAATLMHDAGEAYLVDMPRPIKKMLAEYRALEAGIDKVIAEKWCLNLSPMPSIVKEIDNRMLATEASQFFPDHPVKWWEGTGEYAFKLYDDLKITPWSPSRASRQFLLMAARLGIT